MTVDDWRGGGGVDILLVDDSAATVRLMRDTLESKAVDCRLHVARDGAEAIDFLHRKGDFAQAPIPDLVLLDLGLPKRTGHEVLTEIKSDPDLLHIPVIVLSGSRYEQDVVKSYRLGATCFITIPLELDLYIKMVDSILHFWLKVASLPPEPAHADAG